MSKTFTAAQLIEALRVGAPEVIGYGEESQKKFAHGWNAALTHVWEKLNLSAEANKDMHQEIAS
jgi:hypothetical protein